MVVSLRGVLVALEDLRSLTRPCHNFRHDVVVYRPIVNPFLRSGILDWQFSQAIAAVCFHHITDTITAKVTRSNDNRIRMYGQPTDTARVRQHRVQGVLHAVLALGKLVKENAKRLVQMESPEFVGVELCGARLMVGHGDADVANL